jgi:peptide/nickel transport system substrate-binding protein
LHQVVSARFIVSDPRKGRSRLHPGGVRREIYVGHESLAPLEEDPSLSTKRTGAKALAMVLGSALALTACATSSDPAADDTASSSAAEPVNITLGYAQEFTAYNNNTVENNALANTIVLNQVLRGFWFFQPDGSLVRDTDFGTFEKTSDDPLTVKYTFSANAKWSDGNEVDCDDAVLHWWSRAANSGDKGFTAVSTTGYDQMEKPQCADGDKEFTVVYKTPYADWEAQFSAFEPAHIAEAQSGVADVIVASDTPDDAGNAKLYDFWNKGWQLNPGELKKDIMPAVGPYVIDAWTAGQSLTLKKNAAWTGKPGQAESITLRYIEDTAQAQALQNGEVNIMEPQPQVDIVNQLKALGDAVKTQSGDQFSFEHLDFNFKTEFKDLKVRQAFAKCVPRDQIVNNLLIPTNPNGTVLQSRFVFPFQPEYADYVSGFGAEQYDKADVAGAKALLEEADAVGTEVKIGWQKVPEAPNKRRVDTIALIKASCDQAGFKVVDGGTPTFFERDLAAGSWDVALFAWIGSPLVSGDPSIYQTKKGGKGGQNNGQYSNPQVDQLLDQLTQELDTAKQLEIRKQVDKLLWDDLATMPLFPFPGLVATDATTQNVQINATQNDITWNAFDWTRTAS